MDNMGAGNNISWLTTVPAADGNFKSHLKIAAAEEIKEAISIMEGQGRKGNASRIEACERELRKRDRGEAVGRMKITPVLR